MYKYVTLLVPITFYALVGFTVFHFGQPAWLLTLLLSPKIEYQFHSLSSKVSDHMLDISRTQVTDHLAKTKTEEYN